MAPSSDIYELLERTGPIRELLTSVREEPVTMLIRIAQEHERTGQPIPDHRLGASHYLSQISLRALQEAGLVEEVSPGRRFIRAYQPTELGRSYAQRLLSESA